MRWRFRVALLGACAATIGCGGSVDLSGELGPPSGFTQTFSTARDLDVLFMIDDSLSMQPLIANLTQSFSTFTQVLEQPPGLPNIHIAVVSSDLGAGPFTDIPTCPVGGDGGQFQYQIGAGITLPGGTVCSNTGLDVGQHFISNVNGVANYDSTMGLDAVLACIANLGEGGCGFEHQLGSIARALNADGQGPPPGNEGFLRPDAQLAIILLTNEDDCSAPPDSNLYDPASRSLSDPLGPLQSYRCNEFGHLCNGLPPPRMMAASFAPGACVPAEGRGQLIPVATYVDEIKSLKADPSQIVVAAIAGPPDPYAVEMVDAQPGTADAASGIKWPRVAHSCMSGTSEFGDPGVRIKAFVDAFGANGLFVPVCQMSFMSVLQMIGEAVFATTIGCLSALPDGVDPAAPVVPPGCTATVAGGAVMPACGSDAGECFSFVSSRMCPGTGLALSVPPLMGATVTVHCPSAGRG